MFFVFQKVVKLKSNQNTLSYMKSSKKTSNNEHDWIPVIQIECTHKN